MHRMACLQLKRWFSFLPAAFGLYVLLHYLIYHPGFQEPQTNSYIGTSRITKLSVRDANYTMNERMNQIGESGQKIPDFTNRTITTQHASSLHNFRESDNRQYIDDVLNSNLRLNDEIKNPSANEKVKAMNLNVDRKVQQLNVGTKSEVPPNKQNIILSLIQDSPSFHEENKIFPLGGMSKDLFYDEENKDLKEENNGMRFNEERKVLSLNEDYKGLSSIKEMKSTASEVRGTPNYRGNTPEDNKQNDRKIITPLQDYEENPHNSDVNADEILFSHSDAMHQLLKKSLFNHPLIEEGVVPYYDGTSITVVANEDVQRVKSFSDYSMQEIRTEPRSPLNMLLTGNDASNHRQDVLTGPKSPLARPILSSSIDISMHPQEILPDPNSPMLSLGKDISRHSQEILPNPNSPMLSLGKDISRHSQEILPDPSIPMLSPGKDISRHSQEILPEPNRPLTMLSSDKDIIEHPVVYFQSVDDTIIMPRELLSNKEDKNVKKIEEAPNTSPEDGASSSSNLRDSSSALQERNTSRNKKSLTPTSTAEEEREESESKIRESKSSNPSELPAKPAQNPQESDSTSPAKKQSVPRTQAVVAKGSSTQPRQSVTKYVTVGKHAITSLNGKHTIGEMMEAGFSTPHEEICPNNGRDLRVLILITTAPNHEKHRNAIRQTWGHFGMRKDVAMAFVVGRTFQTDVQNVIDKENDRYGDVIEANFIDHYSNLTLKTVSMFEWANTYCSESRFVLKTDDDMFINVPLLLAFISAKKNERQAIFGRLAKGWKPIRNSKSKYYIDKATYNRARYPDFLTGPAYLFTNDVVDKIHRKALQTKFFILEDVFLTGFVGESLGVKRVGDSHFRNEKITMKDTCKLMQSISIHMVKYEEQFDIYKRTLDGKTKCKTR